MRRANEYTLPSLAPAEGAERRSAEPIVRLADRQWKSLHPRAFVTREDLERHFLHVERCIRNHWIFAEASERVLQEDRIDAIAYRETALEISPGVYGALGYDPKVSLVLGREKRRTWDARGMLTAPTLRGASGSGVWRFGPKLRKAETVKLSGVLIEAHDKGPHKHILATRLLVVLDTLAQVYPQIGE